MKHYYSYIRVSTTKQGQTGTSLTEQRASIERHARHHNLTISHEFEEQETAAKQGRPVFARMLKDLKAGKATGVIMHKIDRSARNLRDWADLGELIDSGIEVHFANEGLDLTSRGGRLSADIQAVVAADYIRNLREEAKKGFYGRLRQGIYPMPAPMGYVNCGAGKPKTPHPVQGRLVRQAFELYATANYSVERLVERMNEAGLRTRTGKIVPLNTLWEMLKNPFYTGMIRMQGSGEIFQGKHEPIVSRALFERVQAIMNGKAVEFQHRHLFLFRKQVTCKHCAYTLIGESQKGHTYYRCHERDCPQKSIREEIIEEAFTDTLRQLRFTDEESCLLEDELKAMHGNGRDVTAAQIKALELQREQLRARMSKLSDAYLDGIFDQRTYAEKKNSFILEEAAIAERLRNQDRTAQIVEHVRGFLEHANDAYLSYKSAIFEERREMVKTVTSNFTVEGKSVLVKPHLPFQMVVERSILKNGGAKIDTARTIQTLLKQLHTHFLNQTVAGDSALY